MPNVPEYVFADARTHFQAMPMSARKKEIEPRLQSFKYLGGESRSEVTYEWIVNDTLDDDYHCFVHGVVPTASRTGRHRVPAGPRLAQADQPMAQGETIVDGPYQIRVPAKTKSYDLTIGLYQDRRVLLTGVERDGNRILLARLKVQQQDGKVTNITADKVRYDLACQAPVRTDFDVRINPPGTWIDFGRGGHGRCGENQPPGGPPCAVPLSAREDVSRGVGRKGFDAGGQHVGHPGSRPGGRLWPRSRSRRIADGGRAADVDRRKTRGGAIRDYLEVKATRRIYRRTGEGGPDSLSIGAAKPQEVACPDNTPLVPAAPR